MSNGSLFSAQLPQCDDFERFWVAYPKKVARVDSRKAWEQTKNVRPALQQILDAIAKQKQTKQWQQLELIPHAATWLRGERWNDVTGVSGARLSDRIESQAAHAKQEFAEGTKRILSDVARLHLNRCRDIVKKSAPDESRA